MTRAKHIATAREQCMLAIWYLLLLDLALARGDVRSAYRVYSEDAFKAMRDTYGNIVMANLKNQRLPKTQGKP